MVSLRVSPHSGPEVAQYDPAELLGQVEAPGHVDGGAADVLARRGRLHLLLDKGLEDPLVDDGVQDVVCLDIYPSRIRTDAR